ncbi:ATP-grasp domain-containing protein [Stenotrophomonas sp. NPDC087984]
MQPSLPHPSAAPKGGSGEIPTLCVSNAVDTLRGIAQRAPEAEAEAIISSCFAQQDQAIFWRPAEKLIITSTPITGLDWQAEFLGLRGIQNDSPHSSSGSLFADILYDLRLMARIARHAGEGRRLRLIPHTTTPDLWTFAAAMRRNFDVTVELPESSEDQGLRDLLDTKSGLRDLAAGAGLADGPCRVAQGEHCRDTRQVVAAVAEMQAAGRSCIVKADKGEASVGLLLFQPGDSEDKIIRALEESPFYGDDLIVVEEYITGEGVVFPSVEYIVPDTDGAPYLTHACEMLFDGPTRLMGNVTSGSLVHQAWHRHLLAGGQAIAEELQRRGFRGHFGIDAVARADGEVFMLDLNARRTGSTHLHDFGLQFFGPGYLTSWTVGNFDFPGLPEGLTVKEVVSLLGPLVRSPLHARSGVVPCELSGLAKGRFGTVIYASSMAEFHHLVRQVHERIQQG